MRNRRSWLVITGVLLALGGCTAYYALFHDWRGGFTAGQLSLEARAGDDGLTLALLNTGSTDLMVWEGPGAGGPFDLWLQAPDGTVIRPAADARREAGRALPLKKGAQRLWRPALRALFPDAAPGRYTLRAAYDPAGAAKRGESCAAELTLGRTEAEPLEITLRAGR